MLYKDITKSWDTWIWVLTFSVFHSSRRVLSRKTLHENIVQGCVKWFHMLTIWFFYRHFGMESVRDPFREPPPWGKLFFWCSSYEWTNTQTKAHTNECIVLGNYRLRLAFSLKKTKGSLYLLTSHSLISQADISKIMTVSAIITDNPFVSMAILNANRNPGGSRLYEMSSWEDGSVDMFLS